MFRFRCSLSIACLILMTAGCQSSCNNPGGGWFAGNSRVAPPPTYSLNIPSVANNQPYYTPGAAAPNNYTLNPNQSAPTPANQGNQDGWRQTGNQSTNGADASPGESRSVLTTPTTFVETQPNINQAGFPGYPQIPRTAALPGSGYSYTDSPNYRTTQVDESRDATRLPVTDASMVRAPARSYQTGNVAQFQQPNLVYPANYSVPRQQTFVAQNGFYQQPAAYSGSTILVGGQPTAYQGQAVLVNQAGYANPYQPGFAPSVLARSSTTSDQGNAGQVGWRNREMNSDNVNRF